MDLVCIHCHRSFDAPEQADSAGDLLDCPNCGMATPHDGGPGASVLDSLEDLHQIAHCFHCGIRTEPSAGQVIPVCEACRTRSDDEDSSEPNFTPFEARIGALGAAFPAKEPDAPAPVPSPENKTPDVDREEAPRPAAIPDDLASPDGERRWMVRRGNSGVYGPFDRPTLLLWIEAGKIEPEDQVSADGGQWTTIRLHTEFGHLLPDKPKLVIPKVNEEVNFRVRPPPPDVGRVARPAATIAVGLAVLLAVAWVGSSVAWNLFSSDPDPADAPVDEAARLMERLTRDHPEVQEPDFEPKSSMELAERGREEMRRGAVEDLHAARTTLEQAVVLDPANALALASLSEVYDLLVHRRAATFDLQRRSIYLLRLAEATGEHTQEVLRARAGFLIHSGSASEGAQLARQGLQQRPEDPALHYLLGLAALATSPDDPDPALAHFDRALELDPGFQEVLYVLGTRAFEEGRAPEAVDYFERKLELRPDSAGAHAILGLIHQFAGDYERATSHFDQAIALNPTLSTAVVPRSVITYQQEGDAAAAVAAMEKQLASGDATMTLRVRRGLTLHLAAARRLSGDVEGALAAIDSVLDSDSTEEAAWFHRGLALAETEKPLDAIPAFARAEAPALTEPLRARVAFHSGIAVLNNKRWKEGMEAFQRSVEIDPDWVPGYLWSSYVGLRLGDPKRAARSVLDHVDRDPLAYTRLHDADHFFQPLPSLEPIVAGFQEAVEVQWFAPELNAALGVLLFHHGDDETARTHLDRALEQQERNEVARYYLGLLELRAERYLPAMAHFLALLTVEHDRGNYHHYLAEAYMGQERYAEAIHEFEKGIQYEARSAWAYSRLAEARIQIEDPEGAREALLAALELDPTAVAPRRLLFELEQ